MYTGGKLPKEIVDYIYLIKHNQAWPEVMREIKMRHPKYYQNYAMMSIEDYLEYFVGEIDIEEKIDRLDMYDYDYIDVYCRFYNDEKMYEYDVDWYAPEFEERGTIKKINWKSGWAMKSCYWFQGDDTDDENSSN